MCSQKNRGGTLKETTLWTNPSPTSSFSQSACLLSESVDNFDYIKVLYRVSTSNNTQGSAIWPTSIIKTSSGGTNKIRASFSATSASSIIFSRIIGYNNSQSLNIGNSRQWGQDVDDNTLAIPLEIIGLK